MLEVKVYNQMSLIDKECWDRLAGDNIFLCYAWLKTFEEATIKPPLAYYITLYDKGKLTAASVCYYDKKKDCSRSIDNILLGRFINVKLIKNFSFLPGIMCGSKNGYGSHFLFSKELNKKDTINLYYRLMDIIEHIAEKNNASVYFSNVMNKERNLIQILHERGYYKTFGLPLNYLNIEWSSFQDYKKFVSKVHPSMKKTIPGDINKSRKAGIEIRKLQNIEEHWERIFQLLKMNHDKHNKKAFILKPDYILKLKNNFGNDAVFFTAFKGNEIVGVCIELKKNKEAALTRVGVDHDNSKKDLTYFNIVFYEPIKEAIESKIETIYCGNALYRMKSRRGFKPAETFIFYKPNSGKLNYIIKLWFVIHKLWMKRKFSFTKEIQNIGS